MLRGPSGDYVSRGWEGETVVCIASGPSLTKEQVEASKQFKTIVINDNYLIAPWADILYFADHKWWVWHKEGLIKAWPWVSFTKTEVKRAFEEFKGQKVTIRHNPMATDKDIFVLENEGAEGLPENPTGLKTGSNSGYQALNIAVMSGAKTILLLGYDMKYQGQRSHAHNGHPQKMHETAYKGYAKKFSTLENPIKQLGIRVVNCTPGSGIGCFERGEIESFVPDSRPAVVSTASV
jgi:hypothetical protein